MIVAGVISLIVGAALCWWAKQDNDIAMPLLLILGISFAGVGIGLIANNDSSEKDDRPIVIVCNEGEPTIHDFRTGYSESLTVICP